MLKITRAKFVDKKRVGLPFRSKGKLEGPLKAEFLNQ